MRKKTATKGIISRRDFLKSSALAAVGVALPTIVPSSVLGAGAASNRITIGCIGVGRMGLGDMQEVMGFDEVQVVAVCDVDTDRVKYAQRLVEKKYSAQSRSGVYKGCATYKDYRELVARKDIDAVLISTPRPLACAARACGGQGRQGHLSAKAADPDH